MSIILLTNSLILLFSKLLSGYKVNVQFYTLFTFFKNLLLITKPLGKMHYSYLK